MTTTDFRDALATPDQAISYLRREKKIPFEAFDAIMHFHILEVPDLAGLRRNYEQREWSHLSGQLRAFANMRHEALLALVAGDTEREDLRKEVLLIGLLHELSGAAGSMGYGASEMGN